MMHHFREAAEKTAKAPVIAHWQTPIFLNFNSWKKYFLHNAYWYLALKVPRMLLPIPGNAHCTSHYKSWLSKQNLIRRWLAARRGALNGCFLPMHWSTKTTIDALGNLLPANTHSISCVSDGTVLSMLCLQIPGAHLLSWFSDGFLGHGAQTTTCQATQNNKGKRRQIVPMTTQWVSGAYQWVQW